MTHIVPLNLYQSMLKYLATELIIQKQHSINVMLNIYHLVYASRLQVMLDAVRPFVDSVTLGKIVTLRGSNEVILAKLKDEHAFPPPTLLWMRATLETAPSQRLPPLPAGAAEQLLPGLRSVCPCEVSPEAEPGEN